MVLKILNVEILKILKNKNLKKNKKMWFFFIKVLFFKVKKCLHSNIIKFNYTLSIKIWITLLK